MNYLIFLRGARFAGPIFGPNSLSHDQIFIYKARSALLQRLHKEGFSGTFFKVEQWAGGLTLVAAVIAWAIPASDRFEDMLVVDLPIYFFLVVFCGTVLLGLVTAPYEIYREQKFKARELETLLTPALRVYLKQTDGVKNRIGSTSQTYGGNRQTIRTRSASSNGLALVVENTSAVRIEKCTASLRKATRVGDTNARDFQIFEPILLPWDYLDTESSLETSIDPGASRRVWIADVNYRGWAWIFRNVDNLPADYQQIFGPEGEYEAVIHITDGQSMSIETKISIIAGTSEPTDQFPQGKGKATISILEQASPRL